MASLDRWAPKATGIRDPRDTGKKNGMFWNFPRFLKFGGPRGKGFVLDQSGTSAPEVKGTMPAAGPISDRGKGRR